MSSIIAFGKKLSTAASRACVLYEPGTGKVVHVHGVTSLDTTAQINTSELEQKALKMATHLGKATAGVKALHISAGELELHRGAFKVNSKGDGLETVK